MHVVHSIIALVQAAAPSPLLFAPCITGFIGCSSSPCEDPAPVSVQPHGESNHSSAPVQGRPVEDGEVTVPSETSGATDGYWFS